MVLLVSSEVRGNYFTDLHVPYDRNYWDTRNILYEHVCNNTPPKDVLDLGPFFDQRNDIVAMQLPCVYIQTGIFSQDIWGFVTGYPCGIWGRRITTFPLYVGPFFIVKSILNNLVCKFDAE